MLYLLRDTAPSLLLHLDMDTFFVSVERLMDPALNDRPVIVGGSPFQRGVVAGCSREARQFGIHSAMPLRQAFQLCPQAIFLHPHFTHYAEYSERVTEMLVDAAPLVEKASIDEFYVDVTGCERAFRSNLFDWAKGMKRTINGETGLPLTFGLASNKLVAKVATKVGKTIGDVAVPRGGEAAFLAPLAIGILPGVGKVMEPELLSLGLHRIGDVARLPLRMFTHLYGKSGTSLHEHARGIDHTPVVPYRKQQSVGAEHTFDEDTLDVRAMLATLQHLAMRVGRDLRRKKFLTDTVTLKLRYADFVTQSKTLRCEYTHHDMTLFAVAEKLFRQLWTRRVRVRLLGISTTHFIDDLEQLFLFPDAAEKQERLYDAIDTIQKRFGKETITFAAVQEIRRPHTVTAA